MKEKILYLIDKVLDKEKIKEENKYLKAKIQELKEQQQPLIDLKNKYLAELRVKNMEIGRLKKQIER